MIEDDDDQIDEVHLKYEYSFIYILNRFRVQVNSVSYLLFVLSRWRWFLNGVVWDISSDSLLRKDRPPEYIRFQERARK